MYEIVILLYYNTVMAKTLVLYVFHEYNWRVKRFVEKAIFYDENVDFMVICNNTHFQLELPFYVKYFVRENIGFDFGGWSDALFAEDTYKKYDYYIFANSSIVGPFIPSYCKEKWTDIYINGLQDNVKLFGSSINTKPLERVHVQSYIFSMDKHTLQYLIDCEIFSVHNYPKTFWEAVFQKEVFMSRKILDNGWNIGSLMPQYKNVDFTFTSKTPSECGIQLLGDIIWNQFKGVLWNENDVVFVKGNRSIDIIGVPYDKKDPVNVSGLFSMPDSLKGNPNFFSSNTSSLKRNPEPLKKKHMFVLNMNKHNQQRR